MAQVYSERLLAASGTVGWAVAIVPPGKRAVVRQLSVSNPSASSGTVQAGVGPSLTFHRVIQASMAGVYEDVRWTGYAGEQIYAYLPLVSIHVVMNGFLFDDSEERPALEPTWPPAAEWPPVPMPWDP